MEWVFGGLVLVAFGAVLRRVLRMNSDGPKPGPVPLGLAREAIYRPIALELETQAAILGISLNDAFEERDSGHSDNAWCLVHLSTSEWGRLAEIVVALLNTVNEYMPLARVAVPVRSLATQHFKSWYFAPSCDFSCTSARCDARRKRSRRTSAMSITRRRTPETSPRTCGACSTSRLTTST